LTSIRDIPSHNINRVLNVIKRKAETLDESICLSYRHLWFSNDFKRTLIVLHGTNLDRKSKMMISKIRKMIEYVKSRNSTISFYVVVDLKKRRMIHYITEKMGTLCYIAVCRRYSDIVDLIESHGITKILYKKDVVIDILNKEAQKNEGQD
jgi:hypothetical protein